MVCLGLFFITIGKRFNEYLYAKKDINGTTNGISHEYIVKNFAGFTWKTIGFCCIVFVAIPFAIYTLSYIPFIDGEGTKNHPFNGWTSLIVEIISEKYSK